MANLITLSEYKDSQGMTSTKDDTRLNTLITSVSQLIKTYCANTFIDYYSVDKVELFNFDMDSHILQLTESPVVSITSVEERSSYSSAYAALTTASFDYYLDVASDSLFRTSSTGYSNWPLGPGSVKVTYKSGYASTPEDLKLAVIDMVKYYYKEEYKESRHVMSTTISNNASSTQKNNVSFPDHIKRVLDLYKQIQL